MSLNGTYRQRSFRRWRSQQVHHLKDITLICSRQILETSHEKAALLSLQGAQCIVVNQWSSSLPRNKELFQKIFVENSGKCVAELFNSDTQSQPRVVSWKAMNTVMYGIPNLILN